MIWILGSSIVCCVAGVAISWSSSEACGVALGAGCRGMNAGQREVSCRMVKVRIQPIIRVVAHRAVNRELLGLMIFRPVILNLVTSNTIRWGIEYRSLMTRGALGNSRMSAGQLKSGGGMVKRRWLPSGRGMASLTLNG